MKIRMHGTLLKEEEEEEEEERKIINLVSNLFQSGEVKFFFSQMVEKRHAERSKVTQRGDSIV